MCKNDINTNLIIIIIIIIIQFCYIVTKRNINFYLLFKVANSII